MEATRCVMMTSSSESPLGSCLDGVLSVDVVQAEKGRFLWSLFRTAVAPAFEAEGMKPKVEAPLELHEHIRAT